jgi:hypothetical protein
LGFDIWDFNKTMNFQQSKSPLGIAKAWSSGPGYLLFAIIYDRLYRTNRKSNGSREDSVRNVSKLVVEGVT